MPDGEPRSPIRALIADDTAKIVERIGSLPEPPDDLESLGVVATPSALFAEARARHPDVIVLSEAFSGVDAIALADELVSLAPGTGVVVVAREDTPQGQARAQRAGIREYVPGSASAEELMQAIRRAGAASRAPAPVVAHDDSALQAPERHAAGPGDGAGPLEALARRPARREGRHKCEVFVVFSGKGGVGKSFISANLGVALAAQSDARVAIVDLDLQYGDAGVMLGVDSHPHTIEALAQHGDQIDAELMEDILAAGPEGVRVLLAPTSPELADLITVGSLRAILRELARSYDYIVVDSPSHLEERILEVIEQADLIVIVTAYNVTTVKDTKVTLKLLQSLGIDKEKIAVVLNQTRQKAPFTREEVEDSLRFRIAAHFPYDPRLVDESIDHGKPLLPGDPKNEMVKQFRALAQFVAPPDRSEDEARAKGGLMRRRFSLGRS